MKARVVLKEGWYYVQIKDFLFWKTLQKEASADMFVDERFSSVHDAIASAQSIIKKDSPSRVVWRSSDA